MSVKIVKISIKGVTPLLMHQFPLVPVEALEKKTIEEQAEHAAYRDPDGKLYVPGVAIQRSLINAAVYSKGKGRASLQKNAAACLMVSPERLLLNQDTYDIDTRPVVVPATKGRILRHRPRFETWDLKYTLEFDDVLIKETEIRTIVDNSGTRVGLLDFRPEKKGPYGRFIVTSWES